MKNIPSPQNFFLKVGLYKIYPIDDSNISETTDILFYTKILDSYCIHCKSSSIFEAETTESMLQRIMDFGLSNSHVPMSSGNGYSTGYQTKKYFKSTELFHKRFLCTRNKDHFLLFTILVENGFFQKIGQYPSYADLNSNSVLKYKNILGDHFIEIKTAINLFSHGIGAGSYVYLRRVIENFIIKPAYDEASKQDTWNEKEYKDARFRDKIAILKSNLPDFITENPKLYSLLSAGIHSLNDKECLEYFPMLLECIENVLFEIKTMKERQQKREDLRRQLSQVNEDVTKNKK